MNIISFSFILALQNPEVVALRGGLNTILKNVIDCQLSRINEALITTILHLLNHPKTRQYVRADVELEVGTFSVSNLKYNSSKIINVCQGFAFMNVCAPYVYSGHRD